MARNASRTGHNVRCMSAETVECRRGRWKGRPACFLRNDIISLTHLTGGGQIPDLHFLDAPTLNPFWIPRWKLRDPSLFRPTRDEANFGPAPEGKLLCGIAGHSLCLGVFGMPSEEEIAAGAVLHGEAGVRSWAASFRSSQNHGCLRFTVRLPGAGLVFTRELSLRPGESVVRVRGSVRNLLAADQFIQWQQHAVLGLPFLHRNHCIITLPGLHGITDSGNYEGRPALASDAEFSWPFAPGIEGAPVDLQHPCQKSGAGFVAGVQLDPRREHAFVCAVNSAHRLAIGYVFRRSRFPWVTLWEENHARRQPPWRGREQTRAFEFGVSPLPFGRKAAMHWGERWGTPALVRLPAQGVIAASYALFLSRLPRGIRRINDVTFSPDHLTLHVESRTPLQLAAAGLPELLGHENVPAASSQARS